MDQCNTIHTTFDMGGVVGLSKRYDDWTVRGLSAHGQLNNELDRRIRAIFADHRERYGAATDRPDLTS